MGWLAEMTETLRVCVSDFDGVIYPEDTITRVLLVAAKQVLQELVFDQVFVVNIADQTITPDPADDVTPTRNDSFINLTCQKAACIIDRGSAAIAAKQAIAVKDGSSAIDLTGIMKGKLAVLEKGWCAVYEDTKMEYQSGSFGVAGAAIMTPFRTCFSEDYSNYYGSR